jgi:hypothetical protein
MAALLDAHPCGYGLGGPGNCAGWQRRGATTPLLHGLADRTFIGLSRPARPACHARLTDKAFQPAARVGEAGSLPATTGNLAAVSA